jgi:hypothetical protein
MYHLKHVAEYPQKEFISQIHMIFETIDLARRSYEGSVITLLRTEDQSGNLFVDRRKQLLEWGRGMRAFLRRLGKDCNKLVRKNHIPRTEFIERSLLGLEWSQMSLYVPSKAFTYCKDPVAAYWCTEEMNSLTLALALPSATGDHSFSSIDITDQTFLFAQVIVPLGRIYKTNPLPNPCTLQKLEDGLGQIKSVVGGYTSFYTSASGIMVDRRWKKCPDEWKATLNDWYGAL